jgi:histidine triad (HIT) family protein
MAKECILCDKECVFCNKKTEWIYDDEFFYAIFDVHPVSPGHALVIPKRHIQSLLELDQLEWNALRTALIETIKSIRTTNFKKLYESMIVYKVTDKSPYFCKKMLKHIGLNRIPEGYNIGVEDGEAAGRTINHLHIQLIPRYSGDVKNKTGGIRTIIPGMGDYRKKRKK